MKKALLNVASDLRLLADSLQLLTDAMAEMPADTYVPRTISLEEVRAALAEKSRLGFTEQVRDLLVKHGANKLSEIGPSEYQSLLHEAEAIR